MIFDSGGGSLPRAEPPVLRALIGLPLVDAGPAYTFQKVVGEMNAPSLPAAIYAPVDRRASKQGSNVGLGLPSPAEKLPFRMVSPVAMRRIEQRFLRDCAKISNGAIAYLWSELSLRLSSELRARNCFVVREKINCAKAVSRDIVKHAYASLNASAELPLVYSDSWVKKEFIELNQADAIFCPSPMVRESLIQIGIDNDRLIDASYGFDPARIAGTTTALNPIEGITLLFVGSICVRKGAHILLESWERAAVKGRLILVGAIEPLIARRYGHILARSDVECHGFQRDVGAYFRSADYFIFPTLEEGSPLVTYEAGSCGLPSITTSMGAGGFLRNGVEGFIVSPDNRDAWVDIIKAVQPKSTVHQQMSDAARSRSKEFVWTQVGARRRQAILQCFAAR